MIDEKKLIEALWKRHREIQNNDDDYSNEEAEIICAEICNVVSIIDEQPKADWIPCEVEMPKTNGVYQTVRKVVEDDTVYYIEGASYFDGQNTWHNDIGVNHGREYPNVVAWQPIQPYKKEGNSNAG